VAVVAAAVVAAAGRA